MTVREEFEAWALSEGYPVNKDQHGIYEIEATYDAWVAWQAAIERVAREWDGCLWDIAGEGEIDIGATIRGQSAPEEHT